MAQIGLNNEPKINVKISSEKNINANVNNLNYIPLYRIYEEERQRNEQQRIYNENEREEYIEQFKSDVSSGKYKGDPGKQGEKGEKGDSGVWVGSDTPPSDDYNVWIETDEDSPSIPTKLSDLIDDSTHRTVTDEEKALWNGLVARIEALENGGS